MWQGFTIALREGIESFLIVALTIAYLRQTGRERLVRAVVAGIGASLLFCAIAAWLLHEGTQQPLREGVLAAVAALLVGSLLVYMLRAAKTLKRDMERRIERAAAGGLGGFGGVFLFTVLMITREGIETTLLATTALFQVRQMAFATGVGLGLVAAAGVAVTWKALGRRVNIGILLNVSAVFLSLFLCQLLLYTVHELAEAGVLPRAQAIHDATEILGPDGTIGQILSYLLAAVPTTWLLWAWMRGRRRPGTARAGTPPSPAQGPAETPPAPASPNDRGLAVSGGSARPW